jgi:hypothetical protein
VDLSFVVSTAANRAWEYALPGCASGVFGDGIEMSTAKQDAPDIGPDGPPGSSFAVSEHDDAQLADSGQRSGSSPQTGAASASWEEALRNGQTTYTSVDNAVPYL